MMSNFNEYKLGSKNGGLGSFGGLVVLILFFVALYFIAKGLFTVLSFVAPFLLIASLIIDHTVVINFGKFIIKLFKNNVLIGILAVILTIVGFPIVSGFLFTRALLRYKLKSAVENAQKKDDFTEYEVVEAEEDFLELPEIQQEEIKKDSEYDDLFK